jgi:hypothetical protein
MATLTTTQHGNARPDTDKTTSLIGAIVDALFAVGLREELDSKTSGDKSDAAFAWGM